MTLKLFQRDAADCRRCSDEAVCVETNEDGGQKRIAFPILQQDPPGNARYLFVMEAPNLQDTIDPEKGYLTIDPDTDPSGAFAHQLLASVGLSPEQVWLTNAVLCLPAGDGGKYPVTATLRDNCSRWLRRLLVEGDPAVVVAWGGKALDALKKVEEHSLKLSEHAGTAHQWFGRTLVPLYHPGQLGRTTRNGQAQLEDISVLNDLRAGTAWDKKRSRRCASCEWWTYGGLRDVPERSRLRVEKVPGALVSNIRVGRCEFNPPTYVDGYDLGVSARTLASSRCGHWEARRESDPASER